MADIIGTEAQAKSIGNSSAAATSNLCVTRIRAIALNCNVAGSYSNNLLVAYKDLSCNHSTCSCVSQCTCNSCNCVSNCSCVSQCTCNGCNCVSNCSCVSLCTCNSCNCVSNCCVSQCTCNSCNCVSNCSCVSQCTCDSCNCVSNCCVSLCSCVSQCSCNSCNCVSNCCLGQCSCETGNCNANLITTGTCRCDWVCTCYLGCSWAGLDAGYEYYCDCHSCSSESLASCCVNQCWECSCECYN